MNDVNANSSRRGRRIGDRELEVQYELMKIIAEQNNEVMFEYDVASDCACLYEVKNGMLCELAKRENFFNEDDKHNCMMQVEECEAFHKTIKKCLKRPSQFVLETRCSFNGGPLVWYRIFIASIDDLEGKITTVAARFISINAEKEINDSIKNQAERDALTGVYNHITFEKKCEEFLKNTQHETLLLMIDVDDFKIINDTLGHNVGDMVLGQTGKILKNCVGERGFAGRLGGDEFALLAWDFDSREELENFCSNIRMELKNIIFDMEYSASMGVAILGGRKLTFKDMYYEADQAVYASKKKGKNQINYYDVVVHEEEEKVVEKRDELFYKKTVGPTDYNYFCLDEHLEYIYISDNNTGRILYINKRLSERLGTNEEEFANNFTFELAKDKPKLVADYSKVGEHYFISKASKRQNDLLSRTLGDNDYIFHVVPLTTPGSEGLLVAIIDADDAKQVDIIFKKSKVAVDAISNSISFIANSDISGERDKCFKILAEYYDADCVALVNYNNGRYDELEEIHKPNVEAMTNVIKSVFERGKIAKHVNIVDSENNIFIKDVKRLENLDPVLHKNLLDSRVWSVLGRKIGRNGEVAGLLLMFNPRQNTLDNTLLSTIGVFLAGDMLRDEAAKSQAYLQRHDRLTGLRKRELMGLEDRDAIVNGKNLGVFVTDIVGLGEINKEFGYIVGDEKICEVADTLKTVFAGYKIYRYDADEMVAICPDVSMKDFQNMVQWARESLCDLSCQVASGYSWSAESNYKEQISEAENIVDTEKENLRMTNDMVDIANSKVRNDVINEIKQGNFVVYLQPKVDIDKNRVVGAEALIRFNDPERGIISPAYFVSILEHHDVIHLVDLYVLEEICRYQRSLLDEGLEPVTISVNFSKRTLYYPDIIDSVKIIIDRFALPAGLIQIEITETVGDMDHMVLSNVANSLRTMGFELAMDDFGTKYSNIVMLANFQFNIAKIDRSLIKGIVDNEKNCIVLRHLIRMITELGIECVVEGVEEKEQVDILREMDCHIIQGFYFGKPIPMEDFYDTFVK